jgi:hypothetical protein
MKKLLILLAFLFIILLSGCKNNPTGPTNAKEIWPLKIGNNWVLKSYHLDSLGNITDTLSVTYHVDSDTTINGQKIYIINHYTFPLYCCNLSDGFYQYSVNQAGHDTLIIALKYPVNEGDIFLSGLDTFHVKSTNENISVPAGNFSCIHYEIIGNVVGKTVIYCTPGVGLIKIEFYSKDSNNNLRLIMKSELISYKIN